MRRRPISAPRELPSGLLTSSAMHPELKHMIAQQRIADLHRASARRRIASEVRSGQPGWPLPRCWWGRAGGPISSRQCCWSITTRSAWTRDRCRQCSACKSCSQSTKTAPGTCPAAYSARLESASGELGCRSSGQGVSAPRIWRGCSCVLWRKSRLGWRDFCVGCKRAPLSGWDVALACCPQAWQRHGQR